MAIKNIDPNNKEKFDKFLASSDVVIIDFWASWCNPCLRMAEELKKVHKKMKPKISIGKIDTVKHKQYAQQLGITALPTMMFFHEGSLVLFPPDFIYEIYDEEIVENVCNGEAGDGESGEETEYGFDRIEGLLSEDIITTIVKRLRETTEDDYIDVEVDREEDSCGNGEPQENVKPQ